MKGVLFLILFSSSVSSLAAPASYKLVAETTNDCGEYIKILAQEGEKVVYAISQDKEITLVAAHGASFHLEGPQTVIFEGEGHTFIQPSVVSGNSPKIIAQSGPSNVKCSMMKK